MKIGQTILSLARSLKLNVVAEGVETDAQHDYLQVLGCEQMQGFLISPAMPADQMAAMLQLTMRQSVMPKSAMPSR